MINIDEKEYRASNIRYHKFIKSDLNVFFSKICNGKEKINVDKIINQIQKLNKIDKIILLKIKKLISIFLLAG